MTFVVIDYRAPCERKTVTFVRAMSWRSILWLLFGDSLHLYTEYYSVHNICATVTQRSTVFKAYGWLYLLKLLRPLDVASGYIVATQPMFQSSNVCICLGLPYRNVSPSYRDVSKEHLNCSSCVCDEISVTVSLSPQLLFSFFFFFYPVCVHVKERL